LVDRGDDRAEAQEREGEAPDAARGEEHEDPARLEVERGRERREDGRCHDEPPRGPASVQPRGERVGEEADPTVHGEEEPDHERGHAEARRAHRQHGVEKGVAEERGRDDERDRDGRPRHSAAATARAARYSASGATVCVTALARRAVTTARAVSSDVRQGTRASTAARRMRNPSRSTVFPSVGVLMTATHSPDRIRVRMSWLPSASLRTSVTSMPTERTSAAVPAVATISYPSQWKPSMIGTTSALSLSATVTSTFPLRAGARPAATSAFQSAGANVRSTPITSPVLFISGPRYVSTSSSFAMENTGALRATSDPVGQSPSSRA